MRITSISHFEKSMLEFLPNGSGIDCKYEFEYFDKKVKIINSWHIMDDMGGYRGFIDFTVSIPIENILNEDIEFDIETVKNDFKITFQTNSNGYYWINKIDLRTYLNDTYYQSFDDFHDRIKKEIQEAIKG